MEAFLLAELMLEGLRLQAETPSAGYVNSVHLGPQSDEPLMDLQVACFNI